jgi:hypothetical protein
MPSNQTGATSNFDEVDFFDVLTHAVDLDGPGITHGTLANDIAYITGTHIQERIFNQQVTEDGAELAANRGKYGEAKRAAGLPVGMGFHDDDDGPRMLDAGQMIGRTEELSSTEMRQVLGSTDFVRGKIQWFDKGNANRNQPPRPAFGVDDDMADRVVDRILEKIDKAMGDI